MQKRKAITVLLLALSVAAPAQQLTRTGLSTANVVARVNGVPLLQRDLDTQMRALFPFYSVHGGQVPASAQPEIRQKAIDRLLLEELLYQEARRRGMSVAPAEIDARIAKARKNAGSQQAFNDAIAETYGSVREFRSRAARAMLVEKMWAAEVTRPSHPTRADMLNFYRENKKNFERPEAVELQTISFLFPEHASAAQRDQARKRAEAILSKAQATKSADEFAALAEKNSEDDWRVMNGDHGWVHRGTVDEEIESAFRMKAGEVSGIIQSRAGYHILRVNGYRPAKQLSFAEVQKDVRTAIEKQRQEKYRKELEARLRRDAKIELAKAQ